MGVAAVVEAHGVGFDRDGRVVVGDRALVLALVEIRKPAVVQR
jgi:hypothetical protein